MGRRILALYMKDSGLTVFNLKRHEIPVLQRGYVNVSSMHSSNKQIRAQNIALGNTRKGLED